MNHDVYRYKTLHELAVIFDRELLTKIDQTVLITTLAQLSASLLLKNIESSIQTQYANSDNVSMIFVKNHCSKDGTVEHTTPQKSAYRSI